MPSKKKFQHKEIKSNQEYTINSNRKNFYLNIFILSNFDYHFLFKVCPQELYGRNCLKNCSEGCFSKTCDGKTGVCEGGCSRGWKLPLCNEGIYQTLITHLFIFETF